MLYLNIILYISIYGSLGTSSFVQKLNRWCSESLNGVFKCLESIDKTNTTSRELSTKVIHIYVFYIFTKECNKHFHKRIFFSGVHFSLIDLYIYLQNKEYNSSSNIYVYIYIYNYPRLAKRMIQTKYSNSVASNYDFLLKLLGKCSRILKKKKILKEVCNDHKTFFF